MSPSSEPAASADSVRRNEPSSADLSPRRRAWIALVTVGVLAAVLWPMLTPLWGAPREDGFPLSTYPMFSHVRQRSTAEIFHVVGFSREGRHRPVPPDLLGTPEVMQAYQTVKVSIGRGAARQLCRRVAARVHADADHADLETLEVRTDRYDSVAYFEGDTKPRGTRVYARCEVGEEASAP